MLITPATPLTFAMPIISAMPLTSSHLNEPQGTLHGLEEGGVGHGDARTKDLNGLVIYACV